MKYEGSDFYCDVVLKDTRDLRKEYESDKVVAFYHTNPHWDIHIVVVPRKHIPSFTNNDINDEEIIKELLHVVKTIARKVENDSGGARILTNLGKYQDSKHLHFHITSGNQIK